MALVSLKNISSGPLEVRLIPLTTDSLILDLNETLTPLDDVSFEYGVNLNFLKSLPFAGTLEVDGDLLENSSGRIALNHFSSIFPMAYYYLWDLLDALRFDYGIETFVLETNTEEEYKLGFFFINTSSQVDHEFTINLRSTPLEISQESLGHIALESHDKVASVKLLKQLPREDRAAFRESAPVYFNGDFICRISGYWDTYFVQNVVNNDNMEESFLNSIDGIVPVLQEDGSFVFVNNVNEYFHLDFYPLTKDSTITSEPGFLSPLDEDSLSFTFPLASAEEPR